MELVVKIMGHRCDLALHPISPSSASTIHRLGRKLYTKKYLEWWRQGHTCTCGVRYDGVCRVEVTAGGDSVPFNDAVIGNSAMLHKERHYLESRVQYLALLGYEDEYCQTSWRWRNVERIRPEQLEFLVHRWDRILDTEDYLIIEDILYEGKYADDLVCGKSNGFNLVEPKVIDLGEVRKAMGMAYHSLGSDRHPYQLS